MSTEKYNKEQIRNRMLKYAAAFWGIKKAENFDPIVKLLLEALSNEIYMLGEDFTAIETRLLEKTARILTPDILTSPFPAHGIVHAYPIEPCYLITRESGMYYESDSLTRKLSTGSVSFYPACDTLLHKADVKYMVCDDLLYRTAGGHFFKAFLNEIGLPDSPYLGEDHDCPCRDKDASAYRLVRNGGG